MAVIRIKAELQEPKKNQAIMLKLPCQKNIFWTLKTEQAPIRHVPVCTPKAKPDSLERHDPKTGERKIHLQKAGCTCLGDDSTWG
ncbi:hypothetical protein D5272_16355 [bacterium D16-76]|nr:hypothetical protein [bacterium D16-76]